MCLSTFVWIRLDALLRSKQSAACFLFVKFGEAMKSKTCNMIWGVLLVRVMELSSEVVFGKRYDVGCNFWFAPKISYAKYVRLAF